MGNKIDPIPDDMTIEEASEFWDTHSVADYPSRVVKIQFNPDERITFVAVANEFMSQMEKRAKETGVSIETLVNLWIQEKLTT